MTRDEIREAVLQVLGGIAPEADLSGIDPGVELREQLDLDSMDLLNFVIALHHKLDIEIPEADYPRFVSVNTCIDYLSEMLGGQADR